MAEMQQKDFVDQVEERGFADQVEEDLNKNLSDSARHGFIKKVYSILAVQ